MRSTWSVIGVMALALAAAAAWRWYSAPPLDMDAPAQAGLYQHHAAEPPARQGDQDSFHYVRADQPVIVAPNKATIDDLSPEARQKLGLEAPVKSKRRRKKPAMPITVPPVVQSVLDMLPPTPGAPHVGEKPQLIPQEAPKDGAPLATDAASTATAAAPAPSPTPVNGEKDTH